LFEKSNHNRICDSLAVQEKQDNTAAACKEIGKHFEINAYYKSRETIAERPGAVLN
jgi:hypothetical protein